jgi:hypothetical protein
MCLLEDTNVKGTYATWWMEQYAKYLPMRSPYPVFTEVQFRRAVRDTEQGRSPVARRPDVEHRGWERGEALVRGVEWALHTPTRNR